MIKNPSSISVFSLDYSGEEGVNRRTFCIPYWKIVIIVLFSGTVIILIRLTEALLFQDKRQCGTINLEDSVKLNEVKKELCVPSEDGPRECALCPSGWLWDRESCYTHLKAIMTWQESQNKCEMMGAHLLVIEDWEQQLFINRTMKPTMEKFWIGLLPLTNGRNWVNGQKLNASMLQIKLPSPGTCVVMDEMEFYSAACDSLREGICQKKAVKF
ncbi:killer cell lectin-like receptor subfamily B member 1B allele C isoform X2 [Lithobates pipiens]